MRAVAPQADIIDYDTLRTGRRSEAVYTVAETNLQQFMEIIGGVVPLLILSGVGFENNGRRNSAQCGAILDSMLARTDARARAPARPRAFPPR